MPTLHDVAALAGVSTATISYVINNSRPIRPETRARVERAIAEIGFVPNPAGRALAREKRGSGLSSSDTTKIIKNGSPYPAINPRANRHNADRIGMHNRTPKFRDAAHKGQVSVWSSTLRALLKTIRAAQPISRADLARRLGVNRSTITEIARPLLDSGVVREGEPEKAVGGRIGRPPVGLSFRAEGALFVGVNIGVRRIQVGAATADGQLLGEESYDTPSDPTTALACIRSSIQRLRSGSPERTVTLIGVSAPGPTDVEQTRLLFAPHLGWRDVAVADALRISNQSGARLSGGAVPVIVENDATAGAVYEARRRLRYCADGTWNDFILVRAGTGIGVGLVLGGEAYRGVGVGGLAGEFGHMTIVAGGKPCACGNRGCWERYASAASAAELYAGNRAQVGGRILQGFTGIVARAEAGELRARATLERVGTYLGIGIGNVISGLGVARVVLGGRIVEGWKFIAEPARAAAEQSMAGRLAGLSIEPGEPTGSGLGGALEVAVDQYLLRLAAQIRVAA